MKQKEYLKEAGKDLLKQINRLLVEKGISSKENPFRVTKIHLASVPKKKVNSGFVAEGASLRRCVKWGSRLVERNRNGEKYWVLEEYCEQYEGA